MKKNIFVLMSSVLVLGAALAGCGGNTATTGENKDGATTEAPASTGPKVLRMNLHSEPPTADPSIAEDSTSGAVVRATFDGLTRLGEDGVPKESAAEKIEVSPDGKEYTFTIREAKWSNGDAVTAHDFEYAWKRALDPKTASNYAYQLYYIKGGQAFNEGKGKVEDVGVKAVDDKTLKVTLENPTPFFLELTAFYTYYPINKKVDESNKDWAKEAATHVGNGPFKMDTWEHKSKLNLVKNDNYWDKDTVKLDKIEFSMIEDENTELSMYEAGDLDWAGHPLGVLPSDAIPALKDAGKLTIHPTASIYWYKFNTEKAPFNNAKIRKAFAYAINRQAIVDNVTQGGQQPAFSMLPPTMAVKPDGYFKDNDIEGAKKLLEEGMKEAGITSLPPITISYNTSENHKKIAESIQDQWKKAFNIDVKLENTEWKVYLDKLHEGNYQIGRMGWSADFNDPINFLEMFRDKKGGNNDTNWENAKYKELLIKSTQEQDQEKRKALFAEAEAIFMDEMPVAPIYYSTDVYTKSDKVKGVLIDALGFIDFKWATIE
ncbi:peptide ABC transporter substrate-binding protein [Brevibacillus dissolubilis]|uniref:peptide ABC transporter substrate-binding protein n=1 Tax=Brevibacillus dissolubilis TaxID=1844116 RepID=UPI0011165946|nr:peptide ABC transporter substrate-binding protein [Brevibacillus dissolubilis]